ncbi:hypothetical protein U9M48_037949 [Paspalum notatum var. saurae]|uniref:Uncharacterized protein n=1 Tax=Paspalum notatum var. saurae TaxID=547442 RepID=A0AAQ3XBN3_PASNO
MFLAGTAQALPRSYCEIKKIKKKQLPPLRQAAAAPTTRCAAPPAVASRRRRAAGKAVVGGQACRLRRSGALEELRDHGSSPALVRLVSDAVQPEVVVVVAAPSPRAGLPLPLQLLPAAVLGPPLGAAAVHANARAAAAGMSHRPTMALEGRQTATRKMTRWWLGHRSAFARALRTTIAARRPGHRWHPCLRPQRRSNAELQEALMRIERPR